MKLKKDELVKLCLTFLALVCMVVALAMFATPFVSGKILGSTGTGFDLAFEFENSDGKNAPLFIAFLALVVCIFFTVCEIAYLCLKGAKVIKGKGKASKLLIGCYGLVEFALLVVAGIFVLLTPQLFEIGKLYSLGTGAIVSAIMAFVGALVICLVRFIDFKNAK